MRPSPAWGRAPGCRQHVPALAAVDDFQRALILEQRALCDVVRVAQPPVQERLNALVADLYAILRTPIFPKKAYRGIAEALVATVEQRASDVYLYGVLASPTAQVEMSSFVQCVAIFRRHGFTPRVQLLLVQWDNLVEMQHQDASSRALSFTQQARALAEDAQRAGLGDAVTPLAVNVDPHTGEILSPADFRDWSHRVMRAVHEPGAAMPALRRDVRWSTAFYARQVNLSRLGGQQAWLDLAIRRAVGQHVSAACASRATLDGRVYAMITSELHKRLLPCYDAAVPIINIEARGRAGRASAPAVA